MTSLHRRLQLHPGHSGANFTPATVERLLAETNTVPAVNQVELHPRLPQAQVREFDARHGIATQAWSPLAHGRLTSDPTAVAARHGRTAAQVLLRWNLELGNIVISKPTSLPRYTPRGSSLGHRQGVRQGEVHDGG